VKVGEVNLANKYEAHLGCDVGGTIRLGSLRSAEPAGLNLGAQGRRIRLAWGAFDLNSTKIETGHYCIIGIRSTYATMEATLQNGGTLSSPGFVTANSGWGDACNPFGGNAVYTYYFKGNPADMPFSLMVGQ
jgi:hypothetical protein